MFKTKAVIHSLKKKDGTAEFDEVLILHEESGNDIVAEYKGVRYKAIFNPFVCHYYVDDIYGKLLDQYLCPICGEILPRTVDDESSDWVKSLQELGRKEVNKGFLVELQKMGPGANAEIIALNRMTDTLLTEYQELWEEKTAAIQSVAENKGREVWEGWTVQHFIDALSDEIHKIMTGQSWRKPFVTRAEMISFIVDNQPYYKKEIPEVIEYFTGLYGLKGEMH